MRRKFSKNTLGKAASLFVKTYICGFKKSALKVAYAVLLSLFLFSSCLEEGDCIITNTNLVKVNFKKFSDKSTAVSLAIDSITVASRFNFKFTAATSSVELPLDPEQTSTEFIFAYTSNSESKKDTIAFQYRNETIVLAPDCGAFLYQRDLSVFKNTFGADSIKVVSNQLFKNVENNLTIYF